MGQTFEDLSKKARNAFFATPGKSTENGGASNSLSAASRTTARSLDDAKRVAVLGEMLYDDIELPDEYREIFGLGDGDVTARTVLTQIISDALDLGLQADPEVLAEDGVRLETADQQQAIAQQEASDQLRAVPNE